VNRPIKLVAPLVAALAVAACNGGTSTMPSAAGSAAAESQSVPQWLASHSAAAACPGDRWHGQMQCDAIVMNAKSGMQPNVLGLAPIDFQTAYNLPSSKKGKGQTVFIVDAFDNPDVASDIVTYRTNFNLGKVNFKKYNQQGKQSDYPTGNQNWGFEIDLDVQMASASCPNCNISLIEANSNNTNDLYAAEQEAVKLGATVISNSWGGGGGSNSGGAFDSKGVVYLASAGDSGYGMQDPADYQTVVSVGGTNLSKQGSSYVESVWRLTGGGCSVVNKPSWQKDPSCTKRTGNDVSAVSVNVAEYDSYGYGGWREASGTSVSSPLLAGVFALAANQAKHQSGKPFWTLKKKQLKKDLHYISSGGNGCPPSITGSYLCTAGTKQFGNYSGPAGWGTPNGIGAF
jgi:subtilase family serine protease